MPEITLFCTGHRKNGLCNADELLERLNGIGPAAVFVEVTPSDFDSPKTRDWVEIAAIAKYRESHSCDVIPVDRYELSAVGLLEFKGQIDRVFDYVEERSYEYQRLKAEVGERVRLKGFQYLNSAVCRRTLAKISEFEDDVICKATDRTLILALKRWRQFHGMRELEMVDNIYDYCRKTPFDIGVFLVGASHKVGVVREIEGHIRVEPALIDWIFADEGK